jgi:hypothetical protein
LWNPRPLAALAYAFARQLSCARPLAALAGLGVGFSPAILSPVQWPSFVLDPLAAVLGYVAFLMTLRTRFIPALVLLVVALFTKETVVFAPAAATITWLMVRYRAQGRLSRGDAWAAGALAVVPLALWVGARRMAFGSLSGTYAGREFFTHGVALLRWPLGLDNGLAAESLAARIEAGGWSDISWAAAGAVALNVGVAVISLGMLIHAIRSPGRSKRVWNMLLAAPWAVGCYLVLTSQNLGPRFGSFLYLLGMPMLAAAAAALWRRGRHSRAAVALPAVVALVLIVPGLTFVARVQSARWREAYAAAGRLRASFVMLLRVAGDRYDTIYVLNDFVGAYGGGYLRAFSGARGTVAILNGVDPAPVEGEAVRVALASPSDGVVEVAIDLPVRLHLTYWGAYRLERALRRDGQVTNRAGDIEYRIPEGAPRDDARSLRIRLRPRGAWAIITYDARRGVFTLLDRATLEKAPG